jgi:ATP-dependent Clp protease ATP-binding subunit ClpC
MGWRAEHRPMGVFLFVGPTGVGKTLLAKELARQMNGNAGIVRIDMSEYSEPHTVARLFGSPPGYVGYGEGGQLTEAVRRKPYSVVLIDEVEKAHPTLFDTFLQVLDEGHMTDGSGRKVDFRNTIIIMTSNVGSRDAIQGAVQMGYATTSKHQTATQQADAAYRKALERTFSPEFIGRIDEIVFFRELSNEDVQRIIDLELRHTLHRLERMGYTLRITAKARRELASLTYKRAHGVRALKRVLAEQVEEPLSTLLLEGEMMPGVTIVVDGSSCGIKVRAA